MKMNDKENNTINKLKPLNPKDSLNSNNNQKIYYKFMSFNNSKIFFKYLLMLLFIKYSYMNKINEIFNIFNSYEIAIKINGIGVQNIISQYYTIYPNTVLLNDNSITVIDNIRIDIPLEKSNANKINTIRLIWNLPINSFFGLKNIVEADLSNYDTYLLQTMNQMFCGCTSITSINFKNINTQKLTNMNKLFANCNSLKELDLSNFDTSNVNNMNSLFFIV